MVIITKYGNFLIQNTIDFNDVIDEDDALSRFAVQIRSASLDDIMNLIEDFGVTNYIEESPDDDMPAFRFMIELTPDEWVHMIARMGAGVTYKSFKKEVESYVDQDILGTESSTLVRNIRVLMFQIYAGMSSVVKGEVWN